MTTKGPIRTQQKDSVQGRQSETDVLVVQPDSNEDDDEGSREQQKLKFGFSASGEIVEMKILITH